MGQTKGKRIAVPPAGNAADTTAAAGSENKVSAGCSDHADFYLDATESAR